MPILKVSTSTDETVQAQVNEQYKACKNEQYKNFYLAKSWYLFVKREGIYMTKKAKAYAFLCTRYGGALQTKI